MGSTVAIGIGALVRVGGSYPVFAVGARVGASPLPRSAAAATV